MASFIFYQRQCNKPNSFSNFNHNKCLDKTVAVFKKVEETEWKEESSKENKVVKIVVFVSSWLLTFCVSHSSFFIALCSFPHRKI